MIHKILFVLLIVCSSASFAQENNDSLMCPYGLFKIVRSENNSKFSDLLYFNGREIYRNNDRGYNLNFLEKFYTENNESIVVVKLSASSYVFFIIISVLNKDDIWISDIFGNGGDEYEINIYGIGKLSILFQKTKDRIREIYVYKNRVLL